MTGPADDISARIARHYALTAQQGRVLQLLVVGRRNREIALVLGIAVRTVRAHLAAIFAKTGIDGRDETSRLILEAHALEARGRFPEHASVPPAQGLVDITALADDVAARISRRYALTVRQSRVLELLVVGRRNSEIALVLGIAAHTVRDHVSAILAKTDTAGRDEVCRLVLEEIALERNAYP